MLLRGGVTTILDAVLGVQEPVLCYERVRPTSNELIGAGLDGDGSLRKSDSAQLLQNIEELSLHLNTLRRFTGSPAFLVVALEGLAVACFSREVAEKCLRD